MLKAIEDMLYAMQQYNLVYNHNFLYYSNKTVAGSIVRYHHPDGWVYKDPGDNGEISFDRQTDSCLIQKSTDTTTMTLSQTISEFPRWGHLLKGKKVCACAIILNPAKTVTDFDLTFTISDEISIASKTLSFQAGDRKEINIELDIATDATTLKLEITCSTPKAIILVSEVFANVGNIALSTLPCIIKGIIGERRQYIATENPPEGELSLCNAAMELSSNYTRLNSVLNGRFGRGQNEFSLLLDMRGYFSRAWNNEAGIDTNARERTAPGTGSISGDHVSTFENDIFLSHDHNLNFATNKIINAGDKLPVTVVNTSDESRTGMEADGKETRPKNIAELYTIRWA